MCLLQNRLWYSKKYWDPRGFISFLMKLYFCVLGSKTCFLKTLRMHNFFLHYVDKFFSLPCSLWRVPGESKKIMAVLLLAQGKCFSVTLFKLKLCTPAWEMLEVTGSCGGVGWEGGSILRRDDKMCLLTLLPSKLFMDLPFKTSI